MSEKQLIYTKMVSPFHNKNSRFLRTFWNFQICTLLFLVLLKQNYRNRFVFSSIFNFVKVLNVFVCDEKSLDYSYHIIFWFNCSIKLSHIIALFICFIYIFYSYIFVFPQTLKCIMICQKIVCKNVAWGKKCLQDCS